MEINTEHLNLSSLGSFVPLNFDFDWLLLESQLKPLESLWKKYNPRKPNYNRFGLSLFSLDGSSSGRIDLDSVREYNIENGTSYDELSFRVPTENWEKLSSLSEILPDIQNSLGRSHLLKLNEGGFFPPHRDLGNSFRLISFFNCAPNSLYFILDGKIVNFRPNRLYFADTRKVHSAFSFQNEALMLILNVEYSKKALRFVFDNLIEA